MGVVRSFGHYWDRKLVNWGSRGGSKYKGSLLGFQKKSLVDEEGKTIRPNSNKWKPTTIDFSEQSGIYVLFDEDREIVYVGQAGRSVSKLLGRLRDHTRDHLRDRWSHFSWFGYFPVENGRVSSDESQVTKQSKTSDVLNQIEGILIHVLEPRLNKRGANWGETEEYIQYDQDDWIHIENNHSELNISDVISKLESIEKIMKDYGAA